MVGMNSSIETTKGSTSRVKFETLKSAEDIKKTAAKGDIYVVTYNPKGNFDPRNEGPRPMTVLVCPNDGTQLSTNGMTTVVDGSSLSVFKQNAQKREPDTIRCPNCETNFQIVNSQITSLGV